MKRALVTILLAMWAVPAIAQETEQHDTGKAYGTAGRIEIGGLVGTSNTEEEYDDAGSTTITDLGVSPSIHLFVADGFAIVGDVGFSRVEETGEGNVKVVRGQMDVGVGAAYYFPIGGIRMGPEVTLRFFQVKNELELGALTGEATTDGPGARVGFFVKAPVGGGGVVTMGAQYRFHDVHSEVDAGIIAGEDDGTLTEIEALVGFGVYF